MKEHYVLSGGTKRPRPRFSERILTVLLGLALIALAGCGDSADDDMETYEEEVVNVETAYPVIRTISQPGSYMGTIETGEKVSVTPRVSGHVKTKYFGLGDTVNAGDVLFTIDDSDFLLEKEKAEEDVKEANAALAQDKAENESVKYEVNETLNTLDTKTLENYNEIQKALLSEYEARLELYKASESESIHKKEDNNLEDLIRNDKDNIENAKEFTEKLNGFKSVYNSINSAATPQAAVDIAVENGIDRTDVEGMDQSQISLYYLDQKTMYENADELDAAISESKEAELSARSSLSEHKNDERENDIEIISDEVSAGKENGNITSAQMDTELKRRIAADYEIYTKAKIWADSQAKLASGDAAVLSASSQLSKAQIDLEIADLKLQNTNVTSPVSGEIIECKIGDFGTASDQDVAYTIIDKSKKKAVFYVTGDAKRNMTSGQEVTIDRDGTEYSARVDSIADTPDENKMLYRVETAFNEGDKADFDVGTSIRLTTSIKKSDNALTIPVDVVYYDEGKAFVYVAKDGLAVKTPIETGIEDATDIEVLSGITSDDQVIVNWSEQLQDRAPINITMSAEKPVEKVPDDQETEDTPSTDGKEEIPSEAGPEASMYVEVTTNVNIRKEPTTDSEKLGTVSEGTRLLKIGEEADGWTKVSYNDSEAYVKSDYVRKIE